MRVPSGLDGRRVTRICPLSLGAQADRVMTSRSLSSQPPSFLANHANLPPDTLIYDRDGMVAELDLPDVTPLGYGWVAAKLPDTSRKRAASPADHDRRALSLVRSLIAYT